MNQDPSNPTPVAPASAPSFAAPTPMSSPMSASPKSATTAGLLGIFLGGAGAHSWYLGDKKNGIIHVCLLGGGVAGLIIYSIVVNSMSFYALLSAATILHIVNLLLWAVIGGNSTWGLVEGIMILSKGDAGLAAKGIPVATPAQTYQQQAYAQPIQQQPMAQPTPAQPAPQPMAQPVAPQPTSEPAPVSMEPAQPAPAPTDQFASTPVEQPSPMSEPAPISADQPTPLAPDQPAQPDQPIPPINNDGFNS